MERVFTLVVNNLCLSLFNNENLQFDGIKQMVYKKKLFKKNFMYIQFQIQTSWIFS